MFRVTNSCVDNKRTEDGRRAPRPCPPGRVRGGLRLLGPQASPCYSAPIAPMATGGADGFLHSTARIHRRTRRRGGMAVIPRRSALTRTIDVEFQVDAQNDISEFESSRPSQPVRSPRLKPRVLVRADAQQSSTGQVRPYLVYYSIFHRI